MVTGFISYAHEDKAFADVLATTLTRAGVSVCEAAASNAGHGWTDERLRRNLALSTVVLWVVPNRESLRESHTMLEMEAAIAAGKTIIPVVVSDQEPPTDLPPLFDRTAIVRRDRESHEELAMAVLRHLEQVTAPFSAADAARDDARSAADAILAEGARHSLGSLTIHDLMEEGRRA